MEASRADIMNFNYLKEPYTKWILQTLDMITSTSKYQYQYQIQNIATIAISLYEELESHLYNRIQELKVNPKYGFEHDVIAEKRIIEVLKIPVLCSLMETNGNMKINISCSTNAVQINISRDLITDEFIASKRLLISNIKTENDLMDKALIKVNQFLASRNAILIIEKYNSNSFSWIVTF